MTTVRECVHYMDVHVNHMQQTIDAARETLSQENPTPFAASVFGPPDSRHSSSQDKPHFALVAMATESALHDSDPLNHAVLKVIHAAVAKRGTASLQGCTLYSTSEPCAMCLSACLCAEVDIVVFGASLNTVSHLYWPQASSLCSEDMKQHAALRQIDLVPNVEEKACRELLLECSNVRTAKGMTLPPNHDAAKAQEKAKSLAAAFDPPVDPSVDGPFVECM